MVVYVGSNNALVHTRPGAMDPTKVLESLSWAWTFWAHDRVLFHKVFATLEGPSAPIPDWKVETDAAITFVSNEKYCSNADMVQAKSHSLPTNLNPSKYWSW